ncbi:MAG TPA: DUF983 domain-containing protein [Acidimicrobiales bacterium]
MTRRSTPDRTSSAEPTAKGALVPSEHPGRLFLRGFTKRCPVCGQGHLFRSWFRMIADCPRCGLTFNRIEGQWSGDIGVNTIVSFGALLVVLLGGVLLNWPDPPMLAIGILAVSVAVVVPLVFLPFSKTVWLAADLLMRPLERGEVRPGYGPQ